MLEEGLVIGAFPTPGIVVLSGSSSKLFTSQRQVSNTHNIEHENISDTRTVTKSFKGMINLIHMNIKRHTAHTIVSWPNPKQWIIVHTSDLMMMITQSNILSQPSQGNWVNWKHTATYIEQWITKSICPILLTHSTKYIWQTFHKFNVYR